MNLNNPCNLTFDDCQLFKCHVKEAFKLLLCLYLYVVNHCSKEDIFTEVNTVKICYCEFCKMCYFRRSPVIIDK